MTVGEVRDFLKGVPAWRTVSFTEGRMVLDAPVSRVNARHEHILELYRLGNSQRTIARKLNCSPQLVNGVVRSWEKGEKKTEDKNG